MTPHQILMTVIRLTSLMWVLYSISHAYSLFVFINDPAHTEYYEPVMSKAAIGGFLLLKVLIGIFLWVFAFLIARKLLPDNFVNKESTPVSMEEWQVLGFVLIGVWGLTYAIPDAFYWFKLHSMSTSYGGDISNFSAEQKANIYATILQLLISFFLVFGSRALNNIIKIIRNAGRK